MSGLPWAAQFLFICASYRSKVLQIRLYRSGGHERQGVRLVYGEGISLQSRRFLARLGYDDHTTRSFTDLHQRPRSLPCQLSISTITGK